MNPQSELPQFYKVVYGFYLQHSSDHPVFNFVPHYDPNLSFLRLLCVLVSVHHLYFILLFGLFFQYVITRIWINRYNLFLLCHKSTQNVYILKLSLKIMHKSRHRLPLWLIPTLVMNFLRIPTYFTVLYAFISLQSTFYSHFSSQNSSIFCFWRPRRKPFSYPQMP